MGQWFILEVEQCCVWNEAQGGVTWGLQSSFFTWVDWWCFPYNNSLGYGFVKFSVSVFYFTTKCVCGVGVGGIPLRSLAVQWLGLGDFTAQGLGSIPGWGTKIPQATWPKNKPTNKQKINVCVSAYIHTLCVLCVHRTHSICVFIYVCVYLYVCISILSIYHLSIYYLSMYL